MALRCQSKEVTQCFTAHTATQEVPSYPCSSTCWHTPRIRTAKTWRGAHTGVSRTFLYNLKISVTGRWDLLFPKHTQNTIQMIAVFQDVLALVWVEMLKDNIKLSLNKTGMQKIVTWKKKPSKYFFQMKCRQVLPVTNGLKKMSSLAQKSLKPRIKRCKSFKRENCLLCPGTGTIHRTYSYVSNCTEAPPPLRLHLIITISALAPRYLRVVPQLLTMGLAVDSAHMQIWWPCPALYHAAAQVRGRNSAKSLTLKAFAGPPPRHWPGSHPCTSGRGFVAHRPDCSSPASEGWVWICL